MNIVLRRPLLAWTVRSVMRHPLETLLVFLGLASLVALVGTILLLGHAVAHTTAVCLRHAPALVVRRAGTAGESSLPSRESVAIARSIPGIVRVRPRIWGPVTGPNGPLTVYSIDTTAAETVARAPDLPPLPPTGHAVLGPGIETDTDPPQIELRGQVTLRLAVDGRLSPETGLFLNDVVLASPDDARRLRGIPPGHASDLAIEVFHETEALAIVPDLTRAFPWPVTITTRQDVQKAYTVATGRRGALATAACIPALLGLALLVVGSAMHGMGRRQENGLLRAFGWVTADIVWHHLLRSLIIGLPAAAAGLATAYLLVFWPGMEWTGRVFFGWERRPPQLFLDATGAGIVILELAAMVLLPYVAAGLVPALKSVTADPMDVIEGGR